LALRLSRELYTRGLQDFLTVLDSQRAVYVTEDQLVQSEQAVAANLVAVYKALGGGWESQPRPTRTSRHWSRSGELSRYAAHELFSSSA
jgi:outer membrane protein, multidrug efflux system